jgi:hypothetical protein
MASTPFLTPYKRKHGAVPPNFDVSPVLSAPQTPFVQQRNQESNMGLGSNALGGATIFTPASSKKFDPRREIGPLSKMGAFNEASLQSYSLDGTCQVSASFMNHLAVAFRSSGGAGGGMAEGGILEFRMFKDDPSEISALQPMLRRVSCSSPIIDFFFLTFDEQHAHECRVIAASTNQLSCYHVDHSPAHSHAMEVEPGYSFRKDSIVRIISCDGVCVQGACYIVLSALRKDASCVIVILKYLPDGQEQWIRIQQIPIASSSAILRWRKVSTDFMERKRLWFVCCDSDGFATLFECIFNSQITLITSIVASDAYPVSSLPITSVSVSDSMAAVLTNGSCALLAFDSGSSTLRPLKGLTHSFLPVEKGSKILAASVCPDSACVAVFCCSPAAASLSLEVHHGLWSAPSSFKYGLQPHHRRFSGSATSLSWRDGNVIAACAPTSSHVSHILIACSPGCDRTLRTLATAEAEKSLLSQNQQ